MKKLNVKNILITTLLGILCIVLFFGIIGIFISGPTQKNIQDEDAIISKIKSQDDTCISVNRHSFEYVTYTCETFKEFIVYDKNGKKIASREVSEAQISKVEALRQKYSHLQDAPVSIGYGYDGIAYVVEANSEILVYDFDSLEVLFYSGGK